MGDVYTDSLELHEKFGGKIETKLKVALETKEDLALAYSPGVARPCEVIAQDPKRASDLTCKKNTVAIVSDGSAVLGLGNIGGQASLPVMEGKAALFKRFADIDGVPICLQTQDTEEIIQTVKAIAPSFGGVNLEDISAPRCFEIEERLRAELDIPVMHDDQHGTATVVLAGLINGLKITKKNKQDIKVVINGAGAAGVAIANILKAYGVTKIIACDSQGIICSQRKELNESKMRLLEATNPDDICGSLLDALSEADVFVGVSVGGALTSDMMKVMSSDPIIFALANPTPEIMPDDAYAAGALVVATGRSDFPNQVNNVLAFPGLFRGLLGTDQQFQEEVFISAAKAIAGLVTDPRRERIIPGPFDDGVAQAVTESVKNSL